MVDRLIPGYGVVADDLISDVLIPGYGTLTGTGADTSNPTWPGGSAVTVTSKTANSISFEWDAATDNVGVIGYRWRVNAGAWTDTTNLSDTASGLTPNTEYDIDVQAVDAASNYSTSLTLSNETTYNKGIRITLYDAETGSARTSVTGIKVLVLEEAPGSVAAPSVLVYSTTESTDGNGLMEINLNSEGSVSNGDILWLVAAKSDGVPANAGWGLCWPVSVEHY